MLVLEAHQLPPLLIDRTQLRWAHSQASSTGNHHCPLTSARNFHVYSAEHGTIVAIDNISPGKVKGKPQPPQDQLVPLGHWSDLVALSWQQVCGASNSAAGLRYIFHVNIVTGLKRWIIEEAVGGPVPKWPGRTFTPMFMEGRALLGTPDGVGVAFLLFQHKSMLGAKKAVTKITVWDDDEEDSEYAGSYYQMLFEIGEVHARRSYCSSVRDTAGSSRSGARCWHV